jgi:multidrug resistance efflux pump
MQKINIFYWLIFPFSLLAIFILNKELHLSHLEFPGFVENKEIKINLDKDVRIESIYVKTGDKVKKGQDLMLVTSAGLIEEISQLDIAMEGLKIKGDLTQSELKAEILNLEKEKNIAVSELNSKIKEAETEMIFYKQLVPVSFSAAADSSVISSHPKEVIIQNLMAERKSVNTMYTNLISQYTRMLDLPKETTTIRNQLNQKKDFLSTEVKSFIVVAPEDGVVGDFFTQYGENVKAFTPLLSFFSANSTSAIGYLLEKYETKLMAGEKVRVSSLYNPAKMVVGYVYSKGNRIVEIPERFRKVPEMKIYGSEIFVIIPDRNSFFHHEVVIISAVNKS